MSECVDNSHQCANAHLLCQVVSFFLNIAVGTLKDSQLPRHIHLVMLIVVTLTDNQNEILIQIYIIHVLGIFLSFLSKVFYLRNVSFICFFNISVILSILSYSYSYIIMSRAQITGTLRIGWTKKKNQFTKDKYTF